MEYFDRFLDFLRSFRTEEIMRFFSDTQISALMQSPYFLGAVGVIILICLIMKWRLLLATTIAIVGFAELLAYTAAQETPLSEGLNSESLMIFVGGSVAIIAFVIYLMFVKSE